MLRDLTIRNPKDLLEVCNVLMFRKYGAPGPRRAGTALETDPDTHLREHNRCIQTKGEGYGNPNDTRGLRHAALRIETPVAAPEVKPLPDVKPVKPVARVEPAPVQEDRPQRSRQAQAAPNDQMALAAYCNTLVFRKYARPGPRWGERYVEMEQELHARMQNACIMSKGRIY